MVSSLVCPIEAPSYYIITLHWIGGISVPINILALYLVWYHSPNMGKYKYCLAYLQGVAFIVELWMSWICPGYYYFPMLGGYVTDSFASHYISSHFSCVFYFFVFCFEMPALLFCFEYRFHAAQELESSTKPGKKLTYFVLSSSHTFPFVTAFCLMKSELTKEEQLESVKKYYPNCLPATSRPNFLIYDYHTNPWTFTVGLSAISYVSIYFLYGAVQATRTRWILLRMKAHMSPQTYKIHRAALFSLALQTFVPLVFLVIPLTMVTFVVLYDLSEFQGMNKPLIMLSLMYLFSELASDAKFIMASHTMASSLVIIFTTQRYRTVIIENILKRVRYLQSLQNVASVESTASIVRIANNAQNSRSEGRNF